MQKLEQLYEGKAKKVFKTDDPDVLIVDYKDDATAFNGEKKGKNDELGDPLINDYFAVALKLATWDEIKTIQDYAFKVNDVLKEYFLQAGIKLIDFKIEFGRYHGQIILADEISPDTCRLWDVNTNEKLDKDRFRRDLGNVEEAYNEVFKRLGL